MDVNIKTALEGVTPSKTGTTILNAWDSSKTSNTEPVKIFGVSGPDGTDALNSCTAVAQRGYIKVEDAGSYTLSIDVPDDLMYVWFGSQALSGTFKASNAQIGSRPGDFDSVESYTLIVTDPSLYIPFRSLYSNNGGSGAFRLTFDGGSLPLVSGCSGPGAPPSLSPWQAESIQQDVGSGGPIK